MQKTVWVKRTPEWIKANPGMGTMYKVYEDGTPVVNTDPVDPVVGEKFRLNTIYNTPIVKEKVKGKEPGLYLILCEIEKCVYVGKSDNVGSRLRAHKMVIFDSKHPHTCASTYLPIREHISTHGPNCLVFKKHVDIPDCYDEDLIRAERELMAEMIRKGYKLYNKQVYKEAFEDTIYVPAQYRVNMIKIVEWLTVGEGANDSKFNEFVNSLTE